jgi:hypothetical protein
MWIDFTDPDATRVRDIGLYDIWNKYVFVLQGISEDVHNILLKLWYKSYD